MACGVTDPPPLFKPGIAVDASTRNDPPADLAHLREGVWDYLIVEGDNKGQRVTQSLKFDAANPVASWRRIANSNNVIFHLRQEADGSVVLAASEILDHDVVNTFDPAPTILMSPTALGGSLHTTSTVVTRLGNGLKFQVDHGTAEVDLTPGGAETVETPAGTFHCQRVDVRLRLKLGLSEAVSVSRIDLADRVGIVAETHYETSTVLLMKSTKRWRIVLVGYPK